MKWLEEMLADVKGSDGKPLPGATPDQIAELASIVFHDDETVVDFVRGFFHSQKNFSDFLGVGESTVAGWVKNQSIPAYAERAGLAAYLARKHWRDLKEAQRDATRPKIVKDGDSYLIVQLSKDAVGVWIGKILARDIQTEKEALKRASSDRAWEFLEKLMEVIEQKIESVAFEEDSHWLVDFKEAIQEERLRTFEHEEYLEIERRRQAELAAMPPATLDDI